jgi:hypothetical protein
MKKFFYACLGILCLTLAFHFGATSVQSQGFGQPRWVGSTDQFTQWYATDAGVWTITPTGWRAPSQVGSLNPPVPVSQIVSYTNKQALSTTGEGFYEDGGTWISIGVIPGGPTPHPPTFLRPTQDAVPLTRSDTTWVGLFGDRPDIFLQKINSNRDILPLLKHIFLPHGQISTRTR